MAIEPNSTISPAGIFLFQRGSRIRRATAAPTAKVTQLA